jgi:hypothetical protein
MPGDEPASLRKFAGRHAVRHGRASGDGGSCSSRPRTTQPEAAGDVMVYAIVGLAVGDPQTAHAAGFPVLAPRVFASGAFIAVSTMRPAG